MQATTEEKKSTKKAGNGEALSGLVVTQGGKPVNISELPLEKQKEVAVNYLASVQKEIIDRTNKIKNNKKTVRDVNKQISKSKLGLKLKKKRDEINDCEEAIKALAGKHSGIYDYCSLLGIELPVIQVVGERKG